MLTIYKRFWQWNWAQQWQYRANLLMYLAYWIVSPVVYLAIWTTIANAQGSVNGMTAGDFAAYYLTLLPVDIVTSAITIHILAYRIQDGTVSNDLLQPVHPILTNVLVNNVAFKALQLIVFVPVWIGLVLLFKPVFTFTPASFLLALPAVVMGFLLNFLFDSMITLVAFWTTRVWAIHQFYFAVGTLMNGAFVPLTLMPGWAQNIAQFLPYQLWMYFPVQLLLNKLPPEKIALNFGLQIVYLALAFFVFNRMWRAAVKRFSAVGA
ncbi:MAG TPA: ABC-2 family transporter protein [Thermoflexales bacterium]|nr:ABC-2 family transporter protein [Thermoflexales bacterium]HQW35487.1 ABC-2 family transporter protein [Thermoflexales bacterium]HQX75037.1 ABC-2 family transporter protein [Thermoflexales bacterium]HQZ21451.1 ABC-2 family transporter protein [Thermoflexales bacterium]HQZ99728.1 ABC-2 family transporter protein [Thermoflexales bacterium]